MERRLFSDGGYYLQNGASVCGPCHLKCESTDISVEEVREAVGITEIVLPPHLYRDQRYDKWGNPINPDGTRSRGELFDDPSVQKILGKKRIFFNHYVKYPRTYHLPWSPGKTRDDRSIPGTEIWNTFHEQEVVITKKMDGECSSLYADYMHARSIQGKHHPSQSWVRNLHAKICTNIPYGWRVCGENLFAKHSLYYDNLEDYFLMFSIWDGENYCLSWEETVEWAELLGLKTPEVLFLGKITEKELQEFHKSIDTTKDEGFVVRRTCKFHYSTFKDLVGKWVRKEHVGTSHNWKRQAIVQNKLRK